ncbi:MAG: hypothetical protein KA224_08445 [Steroidobacteraceae bacterium]|nr:hypothetical protein [Steroidobacteraceae bacterium]MCC7199370.1 hypothetical protein [Gammaproteobacteria bacterium]
MRVITPAMKLTVRIDSATVKDGNLVMEGVAGMLPCETILAPAEIRKLLGMALRPKVLALLFKRG